MPERAGFWNALAFLRGGDKNFRVLRVVIHAFVIWNDLSENPPKIYEFLWRWMYVFEDNKLIRVNYVADLVAGYIHQVFGI